MTVDASAGRWVIIGNSGSGKSALAERLGEALQLPTYDLDFVHWDGDGRKRPESVAKERVAKIAAGDVWVIEGVYGWLAEVALARATALVWLDLPWVECRSGLMVRGRRRGMTVSDHEALLAWAEAYWTRQTPSSFLGHERLYRSFNDSKTRLHSRAEATAFSAARTSLPQGNGRDGMVG